jgi:UDP-N-acetyl-alpha-D-quinovosamine dehydrogenase
LASSAGHGMASSGVLVLGAGGFIGRALAARLAGRGERVIAGLRAPALLGPGIEPRIVGQLGPASDWPTLLADVRAVVHLASRAHAPPASGTAWIDEEAATATALATAARRAGVRRIVLMSSLKVHGEESGAGRFRAADPIAPRDPYGQAKARIEAALREAGADAVILRPPLVYGPGVKANFLALIGLVARGVPLPLASVENRRSLVFIDNLLDLVEVALVHERAPGGAFPLRDDAEVSTPELVRLIARGLGRKVRLLPCPPGLVLTLARLVGSGGAAERLVQSLCVDDEATRTTLGWRPRVALEDGIALTCRWYASRR